MRNVLVGLFLIGTLWAGCIDNTDQPLGGDLGILQDTLQGAEGAVLKEIEHGLALVFENVTRPFSYTFAVPDGATMIRYVATPESGVISAQMINEGTGRRRCNQQSVIGFDQTLTGTRTCGSLTAIDPPGTEWTVRSTGTGGMTAIIEFSTAPVDGVAALLNLDQLSHATYELNPTRGRLIESHDGTPLWVEVTLPQGEGPWPTVIAASPYNGQTDRLSETEGSGGTPAMWTYWTQDWASRGYAAINIDVRGFGKSGGCVGVWSEAEQLDQKFIVDWVRDQEWSDGHIGFYGQSYVGTTPVAAAAHLAEGLDAIIAVAPVIDSYDDWHYGGVPNGESTGSPVAYQALVDMAGANALPENVMATDMATILQYATQGLCDPTLVVEANDPRSIKTAFYEERDFSLRASDVKAAVMYTQGFEDENVKSAMIPGWFNELESDKLGIFGHWLHQHPARLDIEVLMLGWMDQHVKGRDIGFDQIPSALISVDEDLHRTAEAWPPQGEELQLYADFTTGSMNPDRGQGTQAVAFHPVGIDVVPGAEAVLGGAATLSYELSEQTPIVAPTMHIAGTSDPGNAYVEARLYEDMADGSSRLLTWGYQNLALRNGFHSFEPILVGQGADIEATIQFRPTEHVAANDSTLRVVIDGVQIEDRGAFAHTTPPPLPGRIVLDGVRTYLSLPIVPIEDYEPIPRTAVP